MIGYREWSIRWMDGRPVLVSPIQRTLWWSTQFRTPKPPGIANSYGVYALAEHCDVSALSHLSRPWAAPYHTVLGAVDLSGRLVEHTDGVLRGQNAQILALRLAYSDDADVALCFNVWPHQPTDGCFAVPRPAVFRLAELERIVLAVYGVPRLPIGSGPWYTPWGRTPIDRD